MSMSQRQRVQSALDHAPDGVCARWFVYEATPGIPRVAARVHELRTVGVPIVTERCDLHRHYEQGTHDKYRISYE